MQRIFISLVIAVLAGLSAKTGWALASNTIVATQQGGLQHVNSALRAVPTVTPTVASAGQTTITAPKATSVSLTPTTATITATTGITRLKPITAQMIVTTPAVKPVPATASNQVTGTAPITATPVVTASSTPLAAPTATLPATPAPTPDADAAYTGAITGTVIANRTEAKIRFFVEGATYNLEPLRSLGLTLPRATAVLNLYNCDADTPESKDCFWDPYLLDKDGFYEIVTGTDTGKTVSISLRQAGTPPADRIWVQNRTGKRETLFYDNTIYEVPPSAVQEFTTTQDSPVILLHLRNCLSVGEKSVCEWSPRNVEPGYYYALIAESSPGQAPNTVVNSLELQSILAPDGQAVTQTPESPAGAEPSASTETTETTPLSATAGAITCHLQVPTINIRSGPGLQYQIIGKVSSNGQEPGSVAVIGRDETQQWVAVDNKVAPGGWMTASPGFMECDGDIAALAIGQVTDGRLEPTPEPLAAAPSDNSGGTATTGGDQTITATEQTPVTPTVAAPSVGPGQALLVINNGFDQQIRFTLDQVYRIENGPSEFDLQPGQGINILVHPGQVAFSASSPWHGLAGNAEFFLDDQKSRIMWITFVPDPDESGRWILQF
ncbi:MAG: hypothetical protein NT075_07985 [Chloroflexi bacterium]|nr:hypothetical protein [Chloroflexota bacterium]